MNNDPTYSELSSIKKEIRDFVGTKLSSFCELEQNHIVYLLKKVIFIKYIIHQDSFDYRTNAILSDFIHLIDCIVKKNRRYYHLNMRSIIEHVLRVFNNIDSINTIPNYDLMEKTKTKIQLIELDDFRVNSDIIFDAYSDSSIYVHGNIKSNLTLTQYFSEITRDNFSDLRNTSEFHNS